MTAGDARPLPPDPVDPAECCGEGCVNCILDTYDAAVVRYGIELAAWQARQSPDAG